MPSLLSANSYHYIRGGSDAMYFAQAKLFEQNGWRNTFFSMQHPKNIACETEDYFAERIDYDDQVDLSRLLVNAGRIIYSLDAKRKLARLLDSRAVDVAHFHCIYHHLSPSVLAETKRRGIPTFLTAHELKLACPAYKMMNESGICEKCKGGKVWNVALNRCIKGSLAASSLIMIESAAHKMLNLYARNLDKVITPSRFYRDKLMEWGWSGDMITYIPNFIDLDAHPFALTPRQPYLLYFGRLAPEKGLSTLISAAAKSGVPVRIAGTGPEEEHLRSIAASLAAPVEFLGFRSGDDLWRLVGESRAIVLPSEWYENAPMSVIEAFARGKPLVGADIGGIPELLVEGETGWKFKSGDIDDLAEKLLHAFNRSDEEYDHLALTARKFAETHFSASRYFDSISALYDSFGVRRMS